LDLKDGVDKPSSDQLDTNSSTPDGDNNKTRLGMKEPLSQGTVSKDAELGAPPVPRAGTTTTIEESKGNSGMKDGIDKSSNDRLDADSSTPDSYNNKAQVVTKEPLSQRAVNEDTDTSDEPRAKDVFRSIS
jgi:hypothetical protein